MTRDIQRKITTLEFEIAAAIRTRDIQITEVEHRLKDVSLVDPGQEGDEQVGALEQIGEEQKALRESRELLEALLAKDKDRGISVKNIRISDNGKLATGLINTGGKYVDARVSIDDVEAKSGGKGIAGIVDGVSLDDFFRN